jgi:hypothetical protein
MEVCLITCVLCIYLAVCFRAAILSPGKVSTSVLLNAYYKTVNFLFVESGCLTLEQRFSNFFSSGDHFY